MEQPHLLWTRRPRSLRGRRAFASTNLRTVADHLPRTRTGTSDPSPTTLGGGGDRPRPGGRVLGKADRAVDGGGTGRTDVVRAERTRERSAAARAAQISGAFA